MKKILSVSIAMLSIISGITYAQSFTPIDRPDQLKGSPRSLVMIAADWCSTCLEQKKVLAKLLLQEKYKTIKLYSINFDKQKDALINFNASMQSTLIGYKNGKEVERMTGETKIVPIQHLLDKIL